MQTENKIQIAINNTIPEIRAHYAQDPNYVRTEIEYHDQAIELYTRRNRGSTYDALFIDLYNEPGMYKYTHYYENRDRYPTSTKEHYSPETYADWLSMFQIIQRYNQRLREEAQPIVPVEDDFEEEDEPITFDNQEDLEEYLWGTITAIVDADYATPEQFEETFEVLSNQIDLSYNSDMIFDLVIDFDRDHLRAEN